MRPLTWTPVTERLPDDDTSVLICMPSYATDGKTIVRVPGGEPDMEGEPINAHPLTRKR